MERIALKYEDEKSNKFWHAERLDCAFAVNWGKCGTKGRWQIKEFSSFDRCEKELDKLIQSKRKKGYTDDEAFSFDNAIYFDTADDGLHPLTSHPIFRKYFSNDIYYNCFDEETPFGSDTGNDTLRFLEETYFKKGEKLNFEKFPEYLIKEVWKLTYYPTENLSEESLKQIINSKTAGLSADSEIRITDQVILAAAFGQIKITGKINSGLLKMALASLDRTDMLEKILQLSGGHPSEITAKMRNDLMIFKENITTPILQRMVDRLDIPYQLLPPDISDEQLMSIYYKEFERGQKEGFTPIIMPEDSYLEDYFEILFDEGGYSVRQELEKSNSYDGYELLQEKLSELYEDFGSENIDLSEVKGEIEGGQNLNMLSTYGTNILLKVPTSKPWETVVYIPFGGWNSCPAPSEMAAICQYWNQKYGAVPAVITHDELEMVVPKPVSAEDAMPLAMEMYAFCPDCVEQCTKSGNAGEVADSLMKSKVWFFWWD